MPKINIDLTTLSGWEGLSYGAHSITVKAKATGYRDSEPSQAVTVTKLHLYQITATLNHATAAASNPITIEEGGTATLQYTAESGYALPDSVTVTGATSSWDKTTGTLTLSNPTGNVIFTVVAVQLFTITPTLSHVTAGASNPTTIEAGKTATLTFTAANGYTLPDNVTVTGATGVWTKSTGTLVLSNPTANVTFTITAIQVFTITATLSHVTAGASNPTQILAGGTATLHYTAASGYVLPDSVTVTGATSSWDKTTGTLTLSNPTANVTFTITGILPQLDAPTGVEADGTIVSFNPVENATSYEVFADGVSIGEYTPVSGYTVTFAGTPQDYETGYCFYSLDDGVTWVDLANGATTLTNVTQIKFKAVEDPDNDDVFGYIHSSSLSCYVEGHPEQVSENYVLQNDVSDIGASVRYD